MDSLQAQFLKKFNNCHLEITSKGEFSELLKSKFDEAALYFISQSVYPDLTGFVCENSSEYFIVAEIKNTKITARDIYQAKMYAELFKAKYGFLISTESLSEEIRRLKRLRDALFKHEGWGYQSVICGHFDENEKRLIDSAWFPKKPW